MANFLRISYQDLFMLLCSTGIVIFVVLTRNARLDFGVPSCKNVIKAEDQLETLQTFSSLTRQAVNLSIIEPTILWDLIPSEHNLLVARGYRPKSYTLHKNIVALAVDESDVEKLTDSTVTRRLEISGFRVMVHRSEVGPWVKSPDEDAGKTVISHVVYVANDVVFHVVVFRAKDGFFWSWRMENPVIMENGVPRSFVYGQNDAMFDRFQTVPYRSSETRMKNLFVPSNISYFLLQLQVSTFVSCENVSIESLVTEGSTTESVDPEELSDFIEKTRSAIDNLKKLLDPYLIRFWLSSGTLLGWYRQCGLIPYANDLDFSISAKDVDGKLIGNLKQSSFFTQFRTLGIEKEDLEFRLMFDDKSLVLHLVYEHDETDTLYVGFHFKELGYSYKCIYPKFELCSTDFLGYRVLVPCNSEATIEADYGKDWRIPIPKDVWDLDFELYPRNVYGRRYWDNKESERYKGGKRK